MSAERDRVAGFGRMEDGLRQAGEWTGLVADVIRRRHGAVRSLGDIVRGPGEDGRQ